MASTARPQQSVVSASINWPQILPGEGLSFNHMATTYTFRLPMAMASTS